MNGYDQDDATRWHEALSRLQQQILDDIVARTECAGVLEALKAGVDESFDGVRLSYVLADPADGPATRRVFSAGPRTAPLPAAELNGAERPRCPPPDVEPGTDAAPVRTAAGELLGQVFLADRGSAVPPAIRARLLAICAHAVEAAVRQVVRERELSYRANHDPLTGAVNRALFRERLVSAIDHAARERRSLSVMFLDLDHFKAINDCHGHEAGDAVLCHFTGRVGAAVPERHLLARMGGDEFVLMVDETLAACDYDDMAKRLLTAVNGTYATGQRAIAVSASAGVSVFPRDGVNAEQLLKAADDALLAAKAGGRGGHRMASAPVPAAVECALRQATGIDPCLDDRFVVYDALRGVGAGKTSLPPCPVAVTPLPARVLGRELAY